MVNRGAPRGGDADNDQGDDQRPGDGRGIHMIFTQPLGLWLLGLIPVVVLAHLLFQRRRVQPVSSILIWQRLEATQRRRLWLRKVVNRHLIMQVMAVLIAALALGQPALRSATPATGDERVLVVDTSASMAVREDGRTRMSRARDTALDLIRGSARDSRVTLVEMASRPRLVGTFTRDDPRLVDAVETLSSSDERTDVPATLEYVETIAGSAGGRDIPVEIVTDGAFDEPDLALDAERHTIHNVAASDGATAGSATDARAGEPAANAGITAFEIRRSPDDTLFQLFARVANHGEAALETTVRLLDGETVIAERAVAVAAQSSAAVNMDLAGRGSGRLALHLDVDDAISADNRASAALSTSRSMDVALITEGNHFLESALLVHPGVDLEIYPRYSPEIEADVIVLDRRREVPIPEGRVLALNSTVAGVAARPMGLVENVGSAAWSDTHPVTAGVDLGGTFFRVATPYLIGEGITPVLQEGANVFGYASDTLTMRMVGFGFDLERSNVPLHPGFPILIRRSLEWLFPQGAQTESWSVAAGDTVDLASLPGTPVTVLHPTGEVYTFDDTDLSVPFQDTRSVGIYGVRRGTAESAFAVNLLSPQETNPAPRFAAPAAPPAQSEEAEGTGRDLWRLALLLAVLLVLADSLLWSRRA